MKHMMIGDSDSNLSNAILEAIPSGVIALDGKGEILYANSVGNKFSSQYNDLIDTFHVEHVQRNQQVTLGQRVEIFGVTYFVNAAPLMPTGSGLVIMFDEMVLYGDVRQKIESYETTINDLQTIFDNSYDVIYVSDGEGKTLRASSACEILWGKKPEELIGKTVYELEKEGVYYPSATRIALERGKKVQVVQNTKTGRRLMVVSTPIRDQTGRIVRVVNASRDITEIRELEQEIQGLKQIVQGYRKQISQLQSDSIKRENQLVFRSRKIENIVSLINRIYDVDSTVLITGESGVGKEIIASYIHDISSRSNNPMIKINCAAIPETLLESELFGYEKGTFTGANVSGKTGLFELANKGTLFLDEIGDMPLSLQAKLLRVIQEKEIMKIGGKSPRPIDVRIIVATNQELEQKISGGEFRQDLYYRLNVIPIHIPALRERTEDILPLVRYFIEMIADKFGRDVVTFSSSVLSMFENYTWPGNIRELKNVIERVVVTAHGNIINLEDIPEYLSSSSINASPNASKDAIEVNEIVTLKNAQYILETKLIKMASATSRTASEIASKLNVNQSTITRKMQKYRLQIGK